MKFEKGHKKLGGRKPGGSKAQINLRNTILEVLESLGPVEYLRKIAVRDPRTYCMLLSRVLPLTVGADPNNPIRYEVSLRFGSDGEEHTIPLPSLPLQPAIAHDSNGMHTEHQALEAEVVDVPEEPTKVH